MAISMAPQRQPKKNTSRLKGKGNPRRHQAKGPALDDKRLDPEVLAASAPQRRSTRPRTQPSRNSKRAMNINSNTGLSSNPADRSRATSTQGAPADGVEDASNNGGALTRTGRISRALKGKAVHKCDVCDKVSVTPQYCLPEQALIIIGLHSQ